MRRYPYRVDDEGDDGDGDGAEGGARGIIRVHPRHPEESLSDEEQVTPLLVNR